MDYYIQGNEKRADEIKDAFKRLGVDTNGYSVDSDYYLYYSSNGLLYFEEFSNTLLNVFKTNPGYKELELSAKPMFKVGDWLYHNKKGVYPILVTGYDENLGYQTECLSTKTYLRREFVEKEYRLWSIKDAKEGDVLANDHHILILKELDYDWYSNGFPYSVHAYCGIKPNGNFELGKEHWCFCGTLHMHPATTEERDLLFAKMKEAGYAWNEKKKELKKIRTHYDIANFYPGMPVLVRCGIYGEWEYVAFSHYMPKGYHFRAGGQCWEQCIPFNEYTKHLLGTTDMPSEEYINW